MKKYLVTLTAPSLGLMHEDLDHIKPYIVEAQSLDDLGFYIEEKLMRKFALEFNVSLPSVKILFASAIK